MFTNTVADMHAQADVAACAAHARIDTGDGTDDARVARAQAAADQAFAGFCATWRQTFGHPVDSAARH